MAEVHAVERAHRDAARAAGARRRAGGDLHGAHSLLRALGAVRRLGQLERPLRARSAAGLDARARRAAAAGATASRTSKAPIAVRRSSTQ